MGKEEWQKKKYKTGKWIFKNVAIGQHAPAGQPIKVKMIDGLKREEHVLQLGQRFVLQPTSDRLTLEFKAMHNDMKKTVLNFTKALQYDDYTMYVTESLHKYALVVVDRHMLTPTAAHYA